jgi:murein hydrolase activator
MIRLILISIIICFYSGIVKCPAQNRTYFNKAKKEKIKNITYSKNLLNELKSSKEDDLDKLLIATEQFRKQKELVNIINREIQLINDEISGNELEIKNLGSELDKLKKEYSKLLYYSYINVGLQNRMIYILSANDFNQAYKRIIYLKQLSEFRKSRYVKISQSIKSLDSGIVQLKNLKSEKGNLLNDQSAQLDSLKIIKKSLNEIVIKTNSQINSINEQVKDEESKQVAIKQNVTKEIEVNNSNKEYTVSNKSNKLDENIGQKFLNNRKWHIWPLEKFVILHRFGDYYHPELKDIVVKNDGIELGASAGSYVHSIFEGQIVNIITIPGSGLSIIIKHGNYYTVYSNVASVTKKKGEIVEKGQVIGKLGNKKVNKMNFQLWVGKPNSNPEKLNPELWLKKQ